MKHSWAGTKRESQFALIAVAMMSATIAGCSGQAPTSPSPFTTSAVIGEITMINPISHIGDDQDGWRLDVVAVEAEKGVASVEHNRIRFQPRQIGVARLDYTMTSAQGAQRHSYVEVTVQPHHLSYVGSEACLTCHIDQESFLLTGHNFKLSPIKDGQAPELPYTDVSGALKFVKGVNSSQGDPQGFEDVSHVIGGYMRTVMFLDKNGYIFAGDNARLDLPADGEPFGPEHIIPVPTRGDGHDTRPYVCGRCHTTGWLDYTKQPGDLRHRQRQDDLPGMTGTFEQPGVQCEACHGAGSEHIAMPTKENITRVTQGRSRATLLSPGMGFGEAISCGECHSEDGQRHYPSFMSHYNKDFGGDSLGGRVTEYAYGGRYTLDGLLGMDPDTGIAEGAKRDFQCTDCHNPHKSTVNRGKPEHAGALKTACQDCHTMAFNDKAHEKMAACTDCHMPTSAHIFKIDLSEPSDSAYHYSADGRYRQPWLRAVEACKGCHQQDYEPRARTLTTVHK
ncbi:hypothetical protein [Ferrimonas balearica]|uniref:hypothetical protein n=1 Tax=Ferrimonas balearica TaxID=44012 RepID=UPI001F164480|nr:hypothetical protein [Ferrimonas balearica]MBY6093973.1 hypothetical protein [Ferrimonas balearica]